MVRPTMFHRAILRNLKSFCYAPKKEEMDLVDKTLFHKKNAPSDEHPALVHRAYSSKIQSRAIESEFSKCTVIEKQDQSLGVPLLVQVPPMRHILLQIVSKLQDWVRLNTFTYSCTPYPNLHFQRCSCPSKGQFEIGACNL